MIRRIQVCPRVFIEGHLSGKNVVFFNRGEKFKFERLVSGPRPIWILRIQSVTEVDYVRLPGGYSFDESTSLRTRLTRDQKNEGKHSGCPFHDSSYRRYYGFAQPKWKRA